MKKLQDLLSVKLNYLKRLLQKIRQSTSRPVEGRLSIKKNHGYTQFFLYNDGKEQYISKKDVKTIRKYLQRRYNLRAQKCLENLIKMLEKSTAVLAKNDLQALYLSFPEEVRAFIEPVEATFEQKALAWTEGEELHPEDGTHHEMTLKGDFVISKSEKIIADRLFTLGVPYHYEKRLRVGSSELKPDFTILSKKDGQIYYWEHFGMMDRSDYQESYVWKKNQYVKHGIYEGESLLTSCESLAQPLDVKAVECVIHKYLI